METWKRRKRWLVLDLVYMITLICVINATKLSYNFWITEEDKPSFVGQIPMADTTKVIFSNVSNQHYVEIVQPEGYIYTTQVIDREYLQINVIYILLLQEDYYPIEVRLNLQDINDNKPYFLSATQNVVFSESSSVGSRFPMQPATDMDYELNGTITNYTLENNHDCSFFRIDYQLGSKQPYIILVKKLDYEQQVSHQCEMFALDGGNPIKFGSCLLNITISDTNDNYPIFLDIESTIYVNENVSTNEVIHTFNATDLDSGLNSVLNFSINEAITHYFTIDQLGILRVTTPLDYENCSSFNIIVSASDNGSPKRTTTASFILDINDVNDNPPRILFENSVENIIEGNEAGDIITLVTVFDLDSDVTNKPLTLTLNTHNSEFSLISVVQSNSYYKPLFLADNIMKANFLLKVDIATDREMQEVYQLEFRASDGLHNTTSYLTLIVKDKNDATPRFTNSINSTLLSALLPEGSYVMKFNAIDTDKGVNGLVTYSLDNTTCNTAFKLNKTTGVLLTRSFNNCKKNIITLNVIAADSGTPSLSSSFNFTVVLKNRLTIHNPKFIFFKTQLTIIEETPLHSSVAQYTATLDDITNQIIYIIESKHKNYFHIHPSSGVLFLRRQVDQQIIFKLKVVAVNVLNPMLTVELVVTVEFQMLNNDSREMLVPDVFILSTASTVPFHPIAKLSNFIKDTKLNVEFQIIDSENSSVFSINKTTTHLYYTIPPNNRNCIRLKIATYINNTLHRASSAFVFFYNSSTSHNIAFERTSHSFQILENSPQRSVVGRLKLLTSTKFAANECKYFIETGNEFDLFYIDNAGYFHVKNRIKQRHVGRHLFDVVAVCRCVYTRSKVRVSIIDLNNHYPTIISPNTITLPSVPKVASVIAKIQTEDMDTGHNSVIRYKIVNQASSDFYIDMDTGELTVTNEPKKIIYVLSIMMYDDGQPALYSYTTFFVNMQTSQHLSKISTVKHPVIFLKHSHALYLPFYTIEVDADNKTDIKFTVQSNLFAIYSDGQLYLKHSLQLNIKHVHELVVSVNTATSESNQTIFIYTERNRSSTAFINSVYNYNVFENIPVGTTIGHIDLKPLQENVTIAMSTVNHYFQLNGASIKTRNEIDVESIRRMYGTNHVVLHLHGNDEDWCLVVINVIDRNNQSPVFLNKHRNVLFYENQMSVQLNAIDNDQYANNQVRYKLLTGDQRQFGLNEKTGILTAFYSRQDEAQHEKLVILAYDPTKPVHHDSITVFATVLSTLRNKTFNNTSSTISVYENSTLGTKIYNAGRHNPEINPGVYYSLNSSAVNSPVVMHPDTGVLQLSESLDYELEQSYTFSIIVSNQRQTNEMLLFVHVLNCNDNKPQFKNSSIVMNISTSEPVGSVIYTCLAIDADTYDVITYTLRISDNLKKYFTLNSRTCDVTVTQHFATLKLFEFDLIIEANDGVWSSFQTVHISILYDTPPLMISPIAVKISATIQADTSVAIHKITVMERPNEIVKFSIIGGQHVSIYMLNSSTGCLFLIKPWPLKVWFVSLDVMVSSNNGQSTRYSILLYQSNDNNIITFKSSYVTSVMENTPIRRYISEVKAIYKNVVGDVNYGDRKITQYSASTLDIRYFIVSSTNQYLFRLDNTTGKVYVNKNIDREEIGDSVKLLIKAVDYKSRVPSTAMTTLTIYISDQNDNQPHFVQNDAIISLPENGMYPSSFYQLNANDPDQGLNGDVIYKIQSGNKDMRFELNTSSIMLSLIAGLDYEMCSNYLLNITASDRGTPARISYFKLTVIVTDENDNPPQFNQAAYYFSVSESASTGSIVGNAAATDVDSSSNGEVYYEFVKGNYGYFDLDIATGALSLKETISYHEIKLFVITIAALDGGDNPKTSLATIFVNVKSNEPSRISPQVISISEDVGVNSTILKLDCITCFDMTIVSGGDQNTFEISSEGVVILRKEVDRELRDEYILHVIQTFNDSYCEGVYFDYTPSQEINDIYYKTVGDTNSYAFKIIIITILDVNDVTPYFITEPILHANEDLSVGTALGKLNALDDDKENNAKLDYSLYDNNHHFLVESDGSIRLQLPLDFEMRQRHTFQVRVCDQGINRLCTLQSVRVIVEDSLIDNAPKLEKHQRNYTLFNNATSDQFIMKIQLANANNNNAIFQLLSHNDIFELNNLTGLLFLKNPALLVVGIYYTVRIRVFNKKFITLDDTTSVTFLVETVNTPPKFFQRIFYAKIMENQWPVTFFDLIKTSDKESSRLKYKMTNSQPYDGYFTVDPYKGSLILLKPVDREIVKRFNVTVMVSDSGTPPLSDVCFVIATILDKNDHAPVIYPPHTVSVTENNRVGQTILFVSASDDDYGVNAALQYSLLNYNSLLKIDPTSGELTALVSFDRELIPGVTFTVMVADGGTPQRKTVRDFILIIEDVNDSPPQFLKNQYSIVMQPLLPLGSFILKLEAEDDDTIKNGQYSIQNCSDILTIEEEVIVSAVIFKNVSQYILCEIKVYDPYRPQFEDAAVISLAIWADGIFPRIHHPLVLFYTLREENDVFVKKSFTKINASSSLDGLPGVLNFNIVSRNHEMFNIDQHGFLLLFKTLDFEQSDRHIVWVEVSDSQQPPLKTYVKIIIYVTNINDNPPTFLRKHVTFGMPENQPRNTTIGVLEYFDLDGPNSNVTFVLSDSHNFTINQDNGTLHAAKSFDYEIVQKFVFNVTVLDTSNVTWKDTTTATVVIKNINDNTLVIDPFYNITVYENHTVGQNVMKIDVYDPDGPGNATFYSDCTIFGIGERNGVLYLRRPLDRESQSFYSFNVSATDGIYTKNSLIFVTVLDINDSPPRFENNPVYIEVFENSTIGTIIHNTTVVDADIGKNAQYNVKPIVNNLLKEYILVSPIGRITLLKQFRIQGVPLSFNFTLTIENLEYPFYKASTVVNLTVIDSNDHQPEFDQEEFTIYVLVSSKIGTAVGNIYAVDMLDIDDNAVISYNVSGNATSLFTFSNGRITVKDFLQRYAKQWFVYNIVARDHGYPPMESSCVVSIFIEEENLFAPNIFDSPYSLTVVERLCVNCSALQIKASDKESQNDLTFNITGGNDENTWSILQNGTIILQNHLDYEMKRSYVLMVDVSDHNFIQQKTTSTDIFITVTDVNDNAPVFDRSSYNLTVLEDYDITSCLLTVIAHDLDSPMNNVVTYELANHVEYFTMNSKTGKLYANRPFNYEIQTEFHVIVTASDNGTPKLSTNISVFIFVGSVNEFPPVFEHMYYTFRTSTKVLPGDVVGRVKASDEDKGPDGVCMYISTMPDRNGFKVDPLNGEIIITRKLREGAVKFKIIVQNQGCNEISAIFNTSITEVQVNVTFANEVVEFTQRKYEVSIYENATIGRYVTTVTATGDNKTLIEYAIIKDQSIFDIQSSTGVVITKALLDREIIDLYILTLIAFEVNKPTNNATTTLQIKVLDVNDNRPIITQCKGHLYENYPIGTQVSRLLVRDNDLSGNGAPFHFRLNTSRFKIVESTGVLLSQHVFDFETEKVSRFNVTVYDSGTPSLSSVKECVIHIMDMNDNQGTPRALQEVMINYMNVTTSELVVGDVSPIDVDTVGKYSCKPVNTDKVLFSNNSCLMSINASEIPLNKSQLYVAYKGSLGEEIIPCFAYLTFENIIPYVQSYHIILLVKHLTAQQFVRSSYLDLQQYLSEIQKTNTKQIVNFKIISIRYDTEGLYVILAIKNIKQSEKNIFIQLMMSQVAGIRGILGNKDVIIDYNPCSTNPCNTNGNCSYELNFKDIHNDIKEIIYTDTIIYRSISHTISKVCLCQPGWVGERCLRVPASCLDKPCYNQANCYDTQTGFQCRCSKYFHGTYCSLDVDECTSSPCLQGGSCVNKHGGLECKCTKIYTGKYCEIKRTPCSPNPCVNEGQCIPVEDSFKCDCQFGDGGKRCEERSWNFVPSSYVNFEYRTSFMDFNVRLDFATVEENVLLLLMYTNDSHLALEVIDGKVKLTINEYAVSTSKLVVSDGLFHSVTAGINGNVMSLVIDGKNHASANHRVKSIYQQYNVTIGSTKSVIITRKYFQVLSTVEFIGCMKNIQFNNERLNSSLTFSGVTEGCKRAKYCDKINICGRSGNCIDRWNGYMCKCSDMYFAKSCSKELQSVKLNGKDGIKISYTESYKKKLSLRKSIRIRRQLLHSDKSELFLQFRTRDERSELFSSTDDRGFTKLLLNEGVFKYSFAYGNITGSTTLTARHALDGQWHNITMVTEGSQVSLTFDEYKSTKHVFTSRPHNFINTEIHQLVFGASYVGCFGMVRLDNDFLYLSSSTAMVNVDTGTSEKGCRSQDVCKRQPCNDTSPLSHCVDVWERYKCIPPGACIRNLCENHGYCIPIDSTSFSCDCSRTNFTGKYCETHRLCEYSNCIADEKCYVQGNKYSCVPMKPDSSTLLDEKYIIIIVLTLIFVIAILIGCFAGRRQWSHKQKIIKFKSEPHSFYNYAQEPDVKNTKRHEIELGTYPIHMSDPSLSSFEKDHQTSLSRYKSVDGHLRSIDDIVGYQSSSSQERILHLSNNSVNSHKGVFTLIKPQHVNPPIESGFESTGSDIVVDNHTTKLSKPIFEAYNLDDVSMGYSEMSFAYDSQTAIAIPHPPAFDNHSMLTESVISESDCMTYSSESDDASFTCSECEYGQMSQFKGRRNPAYVFAKAQEHHRNVPNEGDYTSDSSSTYCRSMTSFSNTESIKSSDYTKRYKRKKKNRDFRHENKIQHQNNDGFENDNNRMSRDLEKVPEMIIEEYV